MVTRLNVDKKLLFDGALLPVVVETTVGSPEGDVCVYRQIGICVSNYGLASCFSIPQMGNAFVKQIPFL